MGDVYVCLFDVDVELYIVMEVVYVMCSFCVMVLSVVGSVLVFVLLFWVRLL